MAFNVRSLGEWERAGVEGLLSVVMPAHNEEGVIAETIEGLVAALTRAAIAHEILVVNDNSSDGTERVLQELSRKHPTVRTINNLPPNGFGYAVRRGLTEFRGTAVAVMMADGSDSPEDLLAFVAKQRQGFDCVFGSRFAPGARVLDYPWPKRILNRLGNTLIQALFGIGNNDISNAFKLYSRSAIAGVQPLMAYHFNLTVELPLKAIVRGYSYATVPNSWRNRKDGVSKFRIKEMGSRYFFIVFYCLLEKLLARGDYHKDHPHRENQLQVWPR